MPGTLKITFLPENTHVHVLPGTTVLEAAGRADIIIETPCGGKGTCGRCRVVISKGAHAPNAVEREALSEDDIAKGVRLACQTEIRRDMIIEVPAASRFLGQRILARGIEADFELEPSVSLDPGDEAGRLYGAAFDVGTTTIVGALLELSGGEQVTSSSRANPQIPLGDDVIARIGHAGNDGGLEQLQRLVTDCINEMIDEMCGRAGIKIESVYEVTLVGNTTMNHILLGIDPTPLAHAPYDAVLLDSRLSQPADLGIRIRPTGRVYTMANIAGYVGGDTVGVILASGMRDYDGLQLALDIGTNGELVLGGNGRLVACSTAAGPAFEGARIKHGMRAAKGAIEKVIIDGDVRLNVIGGHRPRGICGTGVIDAIAALLDAGIIESTGRMLPPGELPDSLSDELRARVTEEDGRACFALATAEESDADGPICLTQRDVREVQLGKGAISAGASIILREYGASVDDLDRVLLAGAFGNFIRVRSALRVGLLPPVPRHKVEFIGNAAGTGAKMVLAGKRCRAEAEVIARETEYIELAGRPDFQMEFAAAMMFPES
ncbi:MAG: ASKHA domain-containing protein [Planctomycetota bacterium]